MSTGPAEPSSSSVVHGGGVITGDSIESAPLIRSTSAEQSQHGDSGKARKKYGRKRKRSVSVNVDGTLSSWYDFSTTTVIGLFLLVAMISLTILSVCLQRYSTNKYIDIIGPSTNESANATSDLIL